VIRPIALAMALAGLASVGLARPTAGQTERADSAFDAEDRVLAERLYAEVLAADPWNSRATYRLAVLRRDRPEEALRLFRRYTELEPDDAWGWLALALQEEAMGDLDTAAEAAARAAALAPDAGDVAAGFGRLLQRVGRFREALAAYRKALTAAGTDDPALVRRIRWLEGETAPQALPTFTTSRDSDGNVVVRADLGADVSVGGSARLCAAVTRMRVSDAAASVSLTGASAVAAWRPRARVSLQGRAGVVRSGSASGPEAPGTFEGDLRLRWRTPAGGGAEVRATRMLLAASPALVEYGAVRTEGGVQVDVPMAGMLRLRAGAKAARYATELDRDRRTIVRFGPVLQVRPAVEVSLIAHDQRFQRPTASPYFAPREARTVELATYAELEGDGPWSLVVDAGAGGQRIARHGETFTGWKPALRADVSATHAFGGGRAVRLGVEAYDARIGDVVTGEGGSWRYVALTVAARWRLR
jgi:hypothetical protein